MAITKEQIIALIDAKIAGQGSAVDVGGALPAILKGITDLIPESVGDSVAWEQIVTEGTKIAEVTIGEETTDVFAPNGGGGGALTVTDFPYDGMEYADFVNAGFTEDALEDICITRTVDSLVLRNGAQGKIVDTSYGISESTAQLGYTFTFYDSGHFTMVDVTPESESIIISTKSLIGPEDIPGVITLSDLPNSSMTTQDDLDACGLTTDAIQSLASGNAVALVTTDPWRMCILGADWLNSTNYKIAFQSLTTKYVIENSNGTITVTETTLS